jgi:hypothetical protein
MFRKVLASFQLDLNKEETSKGVALICIGLSTSFIYNSLEKTYSTIPKTLLESHCKKRWATFPSPAGMSLIKLLG